MWGKNKTNRRAINDSMPDTKDSSKSLLERLNEAEGDKPEWLSAEEMFNKGKSVRDKLTEELLGSVFKRINEATAKGLTRTYFDINVIEYQGVISEVVKTLFSEGYKVQMNSETRTQYGEDMPVNKWVILKISWG